MLGWWPIVETTHRPPLAVGALNVGSSVEWGNTLGSGQRDGCEEQKKMMDSGSFFRHPDEDCSRQGVREKVSKWVGCQGRHRNLRETCAKSRLGHPVSVNLQGGASFFCFSFKSTEAMNKI